MKSLKASDLSAEAKFMNYFLTSAIIFTVWQANAEPVVPRFIEGIIQATKGL